MTDQERFEQAARGTTIIGFEWLETWDSGESVDKDTPQLTALHLSNGDRIEFDGFGEAYYERDHSRQNADVQATRPALPKP